MYFRQLRYFTRTVELGSMSAASNALHVAQPSLSHHMANLESRLGVKLLVRHPGGVRCTEAGQVLYDHARTILRQLDLAEAAVKDISARCTESVRIGLPRSCSQLLVAPLLKELGEAHPDVSLTIVEDAPTILSDLLTRQEVDLAVLADVQTDVKFESLRVVTEDLLLVGLDACKESPPFPVAELSALPLILSPVPGSIRMKVDRLCKDLDIPYSVVAETLSIAIVLECIRAGICWTILPWSAFAPIQNDGSMVCREIEGGPLHRDLYVCMSTSAASKASCNTVRAALIALMRDMVGDRSWKHARVVPELV